MERTTAWKRNSEWFKRKARLERMVPLKTIEPRVKRLEKKLTPTIIWNELILYDENSSLCQFEVKLSNPM